MKQIGEGMVSKAFIDDEGNILLIGKRDDSFDAYKNLKTDMDLLEGKIKSISIPTKLTTIKPCKKYPLGALTYKGVIGEEINIANCTLKQKKSIGKKLAKFLNEFHSLGFDWDKEFSIKHENAKAEKNLKLLKPYFTKEENEHLQKLAKQYDKLLRESEYTVTHGDLHEENLLVNEKNELVGIIDFGNMAYTPVEFEFSAIYRLDKDIYEEVVKNYQKQIDLEKVKFALFFRAITFFEYVQGWSKEAILKEVQEIRDIGTFEGMRKPTLYIIHGFIGSGKSTFSKKLKLETGAEHLNPDEWVAKLFDNKTYMNEWGKCFDETVAILWKKAKEYLNNGKDVIFDMGFWYKHDRDFARSIAKKCNADFRHYYLSVPDEILKQRIIADRPPQWAEKHLKNFDNNKKLFSEPENDEDAIVIKNW